MPTIVAPITPTITVIITRPFSFMTYPRLSTIVLNEEEVAVCNDAVQVYSRNALFFRKDKPLVDEAFARAQHLQYSHAGNPIAALVRCIPGIPARNDSSFADERPARWNLARSGSRRQRHVSHWWMAKHPSWVRLVGGSFRWLWPTIGLVRLGRLLVCSLASTSRSL